MVFMVLPILKLSLLGMRQLARPFGNYVQIQAKRNYFFRNYICIPPAQFYHWCDVTVKMLLLNLRRPVKVEPLNEAKAIELGAEILGDFIVFLIAATAVVIETTRQSKNRNFREGVNVHHKDLVEAIRVLEFRQERQKAYIQKITRALGELGQPIKLEKVIKRKDFQEKHDKLFKHKL
ncbi:optic atrophy 3 protein homolog [Eurosta solidaginis]|uniref:optic atrophy 3 protein homolog n=1 Tax=Eurosta solidaginis TaxID=178769 RepID=UPI0035306961